MSVRAALALALALWAGAGAAQTVVTDAAGMRELGVRLLAAGEPGRAEELALALLSRDPDDVAALLLLARARIEAGEFEGARAPALRARAVAQGEGAAAARFVAARMVALSHAQEGQFARAQWWLRRASDDAPDAEALAQVARDLRAVRARSPWQVGVELSFTPSDNVNGGSESSVMDIGGLPFTISVDGRALSGWVATTDLKFTRRLFESATDRTQMTFRLGGRWVALSEESRDLIDANSDPDDPEITGSDFASRSAEVRLSHDHVLSWGMVGGSVALARSWAGDDDPVESFRLAGNALVPVGEAQALRFAASWEHRRPLGDDAPQRRVGAELGWSAAVGTLGQASLGVSRSKVLSEINNQASESWGVQAGFELAQPVGPARLGASVALSRTEYPDYGLFLFREARQDERVSLRLEARFPDWSYLGFEPVVTVESARTDSNVSRFDTESFGVGFTVRSSF